MKTAVIIAAGAITDYTYLRTFVNPDKDVIICADGGYDHALAMGLVPHVLVGDFDSLRHVPSLSAQTQLIQLDTDKNYTDTEIAVQQALAQGITHLTLLGVTGTRLDHSLANLLMLNHLNTDTLTTCIINEHNKIYVCKKDKKITLREPAGQMVSLIPLSPCHGVSTTGLQYELSDAQLQPHYDQPGVSLGYGYSVSNVIGGDGYVTATVTVASGELWVIVAKD